MGKGMALARWAMVLRAFASLRDMRGKFNEEAGEE